MSTLALTEEEREVLYSLAVDAYDAGLFAKAVEIFSGLATIKKESAKYWMGLAASYHMMKDYPKAVQAYLAAATLKPKEPRAFLHAAECLWLQEKREDAILTLETAEKVALANKQNHKEILAQIELYNSAWKGK